jgi:allantoinase
MPDIAIKSERVVTPKGSGKAVVLISKGKIHDVVSEVSGADFQIIDVGRKLLMPAVVDPHVHINEPGRTAWEGFDTATKSAIAGGIATLVDMPLNSSPVTTSVAAFDEKIKPPLKIYIRIADFGEELFLVTKSISNRLSKKEFWVSKHFLPTQG